LRQLRAGGSVIDQCRENASFCAALNAGAIRKVQQALGYQRLQKRVFLRIAQAGPMLHAGTIIAERIERLLAQLVVFDSVRLLQ